MNGSTADVDMSHADRKFPDLAAYLERIGFRGQTRPDLDTLSELQRIHAHTVPFENIDVQLRRPVELDLQVCFDKIVRRRRGGWCYELNGVFGCALQEIGFDVTRLCAGVMRERAGDAQLGNHLCLLVRLDRPYLVDVGFGGSLLHPIPLQESEYAHSPYEISLRTVDGFWRFSERAWGAPFSFDFKIDAANEALLAEKCRMLQTNRESPFVQNLVVQRRVDGAHLSLRGRVLTTLTANGEHKSEIPTADAFVAT
jgi:N-hydroxyarylamine O-acetyltransferase